MMSREDADDSPPPTPMHSTPTRSRARSGRYLLVAVTAAALCATSALAQSDVHKHSAGEPAPARLGTLAFPSSANARAQPLFVRGIALLHSFHYDEAAAAFKSAERADPAFALPYWFEAFTHSHLLWGEDDPNAARAVLARLAPARDARLARAATPRERAYASAIEAFYADTTTPARARAFADTMVVLANTYRDDLEAEAFASLGVMLALAQDAYPPGEVKARSDEMVARAERVFAANPNHPGAAHYLIHVSDIDPAFTHRSLPAARAYARIAPDASHALHMPSHVFLRLGMWDDVASSNERSWAASRREMVRDHLGGADLDAHSLRFLAYAYLESGRWRAARALIDSARRVIGTADVSGASHVDGRYAISDLSFLVAAETGRWNDVVMPPPPRPPENQRERFFLIESNYARAVTLGMRGDTTQLAVSATAMRAMADSLGRVAPILDYLATELEGLVARARGDRPRAIERFAHAGEFEDRSPLVGPPSFLIAREQLGNVYLEARSADSAAVQFERVLTHSPNRSAALLGLAHARLALGDRDAAAKAYAQLRTNWRRADADVPALAEVRRSAGGKP